MKQLVIIADIIEETHAALLIKYASKVVCAGLYGKKYNKLKKVLAKRFFCMYTT